MIPRWILFVGLVALVIWVWMRRQGSQVQMASANPNFGKGAPDTGSSFMDLLPITSQWQNQPTSRYGSALETIVPRMADSWLDKLTGAINNGLRKQAPAAGNNDNWDATWDQYNQEMAYDGEELPL